LTEHLGIAASFLYIFRRNQVARMASAYTKGVSAGKELATALTAGCFYEATGRFWFFVSMVFCPDGGIGRRASFRS
jgi:hypothetical protein